MGRAELPLHAPGTQVDRGYIGESIPRPNAQRLLQGRGTFIDDLRFPRIAHVAFFRSPYAHALVKKLDFKAARRAPGVIAVLDGRAVAEYCTPWVAVLAHLKGIKSPPQHAIAIERACWQGEALAAVVAESRSQAEDGVQLIEAEWQELPVVVDMEESLAGSKVIHPELKDNICFKREHDTGGVDEAFAKADVVVEDTFLFGRHTGVCLEGRAILADYNAAEHSLTVYQATQAPHMMQDIFSRHLNIPEANVRVITKNVTCQYRAVGHPIAVALTEGIVDLAARKLGMDPAEFRRRNLIGDDAYPYSSPAGLKFEKLSHHKTLELLLRTMKYETLRAEQERLRKEGIYRGIGLAAMIEVTNPSPAFYGVGGARISAQDGATLRLEPTGMVTVMCSVTEQGQGTEGIFAQIAASAVGVSMDKVRVITGDTGVTPYGGGTWASRGAGIGGEAVLPGGRGGRSHTFRVGGPPPPHGKRPAPTPRQ